MADKRTYIAIDLKSFYASVECVERKLDPLNTNLVVADASRTEKTICLAVSPSLKSYGISGRARLFEVIERVKEVNIERLSRIRPYTFSGVSARFDELQADPSLELSYIIAPPRMKKYMEYSTRIYDIYLKYVSPEDIHVYSIDEVFMDVTNYLSLYQITPRELCACLIREIYFTTGITATGGIGTNLYLAKVAMDIVAKHVPEDSDGVRIAELDELTYRKLLWTHEPLTDFWRVGRGISARLAKYQIYTMGDIARCSIGDPHDFYNEELLYRLFGINAELLIDHAWGYEPTTMDLVKSYRPENNSMSTGQVLAHPYSFEKGKIIVREMTDALSLDMVDQGLVTDQLVLYLGYEKNSGYAHGSIHLGKYTSSSRLMIEKILELYERVVDPREEVRRLSITAGRVLPEAEGKKKYAYTQMDLFTDVDALEEQEAREKEKEAQEKNLQKALLSIQKKFGKNAILKGTSYEEGATTRERNGQIGGHKAE